MVADVEGLENLDASESPCSKTQCKGGSHAKDGEEFVFFFADRSNRSQEEIRYSENPPLLRFTLHGERSTTMFFRESRDGSQPSDQRADDAEAPL